MSFGPTPADRSCKAKISNFVASLIPHLFEQDVLGLDVPVDEIFLMNTLESLHDLDDDLDRMLDGEGLPGKLGLEGKEVALIAVLHDDDNEVGSWVEG